MIKLFKDSDLPTGQEIFNSLKRIRNADRKEVESLRDWVFDKTEILKSVISQFIEANDYLEEPEVYSERLLRYHHLNAGMMGLVEGLHERAIFIPYKELTEDSRVASATNKQKLTAGDRELYAKGEASDLKGLKKDLEETQRNLWERIQLCRGARRF
jgi:hypothetical protein